MKEKKNATSQPIIQQLRANGYFDEHLKDEARSKLEAISVLVIADTMHNWALHHDDLPQSGLIPISNLDKHLASFYWAMPDINWQFAQQPRIIHSNSFEIPNRFPETDPSIGQLSIIYKEKGNPNLQALIFTFFQGGGFAIGYTQGLPEWSYGLNNPANNYLDLFLIRNLLINDYWEALIDAAHDTIKQHLLLRDAINHISFN